MSNTCTIRVILQFIFYLGVFGGKGRDGVRRASTDTACGGGLRVLTEMCGEIKSVNFPNMYSRKLDCAWHIKAPPGMTISLTFLSFDVEKCGIYNRCTCDAVEIRNGADSAANLVVRRCGKVNPGTFVSTTNSFFLSFKSDYSVQKGGFSARYFVVDKTRRSVPAVAKEPCKGDGIVIGDRNGEIKSPRYDGVHYYPPRKTCKWTFSPPEGAKIHVAATFFDVELTPGCTKDHVTFYGKDNKLGTYCGNQHKLILSADQLKILFVSDGSGQAKGFRMEYKITGGKDESKERSNPTEMTWCPWTSTPAPVTTTIAPTTTLSPEQETSLACTVGVKLTASSGKILSPHFPQRYANNQNCKWIIQAPPGANITLVFDFFDVERARLRSPCRFDSLAIYDGGDATPKSPLLGKFCGEMKHVSTVKSSRNLMYIVFRSDSTVAKNGFELEYEVEGGKERYGGMPATQPTPTTTQSPQQTAVQACAGTAKMTNPNGVIQSLNYPEVYGHNLKCTWLIEAPAGKEILLEFMTMDIEFVGGCEYDSLALYDGTIAQASRMGNLRCGTTKPVNNLRSSSNKLYLVFESDESINRKGFSVRYMFLHPIVSCTKEQFSCYFGGCVPKAVACNGVNDCVDTSDEAQYACGGCGKPFLQPYISSARIVGGVEARPHSFPWAVSLRFNGRHFCGGSLIADKYVLTAAHCVTTSGRVDAPKGYTVVIGIHNRKAEESTEQVLEAEKLIQHEKYDDVSLENDIALIRLKVSYKETASTTPVCLPSSTDTVTTGDATVIGWGETEGDGDAYVLNQVNLPVLTSAVCKRAFPNDKITENMLCVGSLQGGKDACKGDSGGPAVQLIGGYWKQIGLVSWGRGCADIGKPGVYTNVQKYLPWINKSMIP